ncbi:MAG: P22 phage major capsid protein family protein [Bryobacteraceae bacterium]
MSNDIKVLSFVANEMLMQVKNNLQFVKNVSGEEFAGRFTESPKKGETIKIRKPTRYVGRDGETFSAEDYLERTVDMVVQTTAGVDILLTNRELMFDLDNISERVVKPAAETLANKIDRAALAIATAAVYNTVGTPGTVPTALKTYNQARAKMSWEGCPPGQQSLLVTPDMQVEAVDAGKTLFNPDGEIGSQYELGIVGRHAGAKVYECQNLVINTVGPLGGTPLVNGATQTGASLVTDGWTAAAASRLKKGNIFTIDGVYAVNPWTRETIGALRQFTVTADASSDGSGNATLAISPAIITSGPFQNVTASAADNAAITVLGTASTASPQGLRFHRDAFLFGSFDQPSPGSAVTFSKQVSDKQTGIKIRYIRDWDTTNNKQIDRFDCVWAFGVAYPEFAARIAS